jgi:D-beta-D-heptose 7-phosphate kinase/D-beta-D-heptose 1-phosphate adenosyltransferase
MFQQLQSLKVLIIGDFCTDIYKYGHVARLSPEAPVPIFVVEKEIRYEGMSGNVLNNFKSFSIFTDLVCGNKDTIKERYIDIKSRQHVLRVDKDVLSEQAEFNLNLNQYDAIVISDYNKGVITENTITKIKQSYNGPIFVDSKKRDLSIFQGCILKINNHDYNKASKMPIDTDIIITTGENGAIFNGKIYPVEKINFYDIVGAGDSFLAGLVVKYLLTKDLEQSIRFANICAANVVKQNGTAKIIFDEVKHEL